MRKPLARLVVQITRITPVAWVTPVSPITRPAAFTPLTAFTPPAAFPSPAFPSPAFPSLAAFKPLAAFTPLAAFVRPATVLGLLATLALAAGCAETGSGNGRLPDDLAEARARWRSRTASDYSFTWQQDCLCLVDMVRPIRISVSGDGITDATFADDRQPVGQPTRSFLLTIDGVFATITEAIEDGAAQIDVDYDPTWSFPASVFIDYDRRTADEEMSLALSDFAPSTP